jgi:hypothetical protein
MAKIERLIRKPKRSVASYPGLPHVFQRCTRKREKAWSIMWCNDHVRTLFGTRRGLKISAYSPTRTSTCTVLYSSLAGQPYIRRLSVRVTCLFELSPKWAAKSMSRNITHLVAITWNSKLRSTRTARFSPRDSSRVPDRPRASSVVAKSMSRNITHLVAITWNSKLRSTRTARFSPGDSSRVPDRPRASSVVALLTVLSNTITLGW